MPKAPEPWTLDQAEAKFDQIAETLHRVCPRVEDLREACVFLFAGSLAGLAPDEAAVYLMRTSALLDVGADSLRKALKR